MLTLPSCNASYDLKAHRHNFSIWAAARAAQRGFTDVDKLRRALEASGIVKYLEAEEAAGTDAAGFDAHHRQWCSAIVDFLTNAGIERATFGRAAKLVAVYLKAAVVLGPRSDTSLAKVAHPPIDRILLANLAASSASAADRKKWVTINWTSLNEDGYRELIEDLRKLLGPDEPFWSLERYWTVTAASDE